MDLLVTHGPTQAILDGTWGGDRGFCEELREAACRARPWVAAFGHLHESYGEEEVDGICSVDASTCNLARGATNPPMVVDL